MKPSLKGHDLSVLDGSWNRSKQQESMCPSCLCERYNDGSVFLYVCSLTKGFCGVEEVNTLRTQHAPEKLPASQQDNHRTAANYYLLYSFIILSSITSIHTYKYNKKKKRAKFHTFNRHKKHNMTNKTSQIILLELQSCVN